MSGPGIARFDDLYLFDSMYVDGALIHNYPVEVDPSEGMFSLTTHGSTEIAQRPWFGAAKPKNASRYAFTFEVLARDEDSWFALKGAESKAAPVYFGFGGRVTDTFAATSGSSYTLIRPYAVGIVTGLLEIDYPVEVRLNGVVTPSAATVSGQTVTAAATGTIAVTYPPVFRVRFARGLPERIQAHNDARASVVLEEMRS